MVAWEQAVGCHVQQQTQEQTASPEERIIHGHKEYDLHSPRIK